MGQTKALNFIFSPVAMGPLRKGKRNFFTGVSFGEQRFTKKKVVSPKFGAASCLEVGFWSPVNLGQRRTKLQGLSYFFSFYGMIRSLGSYFAGNHFFLISVLCALIHAS